jgi:hypothetical protein
VEEWRRGGVEERMSGGEDEWISGGEDKRRSWSGVAGLRGGVLGLWAGAHSGGDYGGAGAG